MGAKLLFVASPRGDLGVEPTTVFSEFAVGIFGFLATGESRALLATVDLFLLVNKGATSCSSSWLDEEVDSGDLLC